MIVNPVSANPARAATIDPTVTGSGTALLSFLVCTASPSDVATADARAEVEADLDRRSVSAWASAAAEASIALSREAEGIDEAIRNIGTVCPKQF